MPQNVEIKYTPAAVDDMDEIFSFISADNVDASVALLARLDEGIGRLSHFPFAGLVLSQDDYELIQSGYRFIVVHPYLVFYRVIDESVIIHRILHARRDYLRELFDQGK